MDSPDDLRAEIRAFMLSGHPFTEVEDIVDAVDLPEDTKAALWLYAWSYLSPRRQRADAERPLNSSLATK